VNKQVIGRIDKVDFPEWNLSDIDAKIDSGAYSCSIHCDQVEAFYIKGVHHVRFTVYKDEAPHVEECTVFASKQVKNSFGQIEYRYFVKTTIRLFEKNYIIELALTNRSSMKFPVLLGRKLLHNRFMIDVTKQNLSYKQKMKTSKDSGRKSAKQKS
jgi:hypothetical protein